MAEALELLQVSHRFGDHLAVDDVDLTVAAGECFGLLGPNGAGKTTTIRLLNTLLPVRQGRIRVFGLDVSRQAMAVRRLLGYVPQQLSVEAALTGRENVAWFARLFDVPRRQRAGRIDEVLAMVDLSDTADRLARTYSGGMIRRLELAQALVNRPALLVLDEPTVGLDPVARDSVWSRVRQMQREYGMTVVLTTHYMEEADALCGRVAMMHRGSLRAVGAPAELKAGLESRLGSSVSLEDVFRHYTGDSLTDASESSAVSGSSKGEMRSVRSTRSTRSTARRLG